MSHTFLREALCGQAEWTQRRRERGKGRKSAIRKIKPDRKITEERHRWLDKDVLPRTDIRASGQL